MKRAPRMAWQAAGAALLGWLAWLAWQPPTPAPPPLQVRAPIPEPVPEPAPEQLPNEASAAGQQPDRAKRPATPRLWRVVTHRFVWKQAARELHKQLADAGLPVRVIARKEDVELHAFDDARLFTRRADAVKARQAWKNKGFEASLIRPDEAHFGVALGRLYLAAYARQLQARLAASGMRYRYERRLVHIPTWRFTFPPTPKPAAEKLWNRLQQMGVADPVLMPERQFQSLYGKAPAETGPARRAQTRPTNSAKRSKR